ncbi:unnamed protein product [Diamesa serratosioi]
MTSSTIKIIISVVLLVVFIASVLSSPLPGSSHHKIRIHIPVKHHTHIHTKTKIKTVHIPVKEKKKAHHYEEDWAYSKKSKRFLPHPNYSRFRF